VRSTIRELTHKKRSHHTSIGVNNEHLLPDVLGMAGRSVHEGERVARAGLGLGGNLAPVDGQHRRVMHQAEGDESM